MSRSRRLVRLRSAHHLAATGLWTALLVASAAFAAAPAVAGEGGSGERASSAGPVEVVALVEAHDGSLDVVTYTAPDAAGGEQLADELEALPDVRTADVNDVRFSALTNDPYFPQQWVFQQFSFLPARSIADPAGQVVAIVDSGVMASHEDLGGGIVLWGADCYTYTSCVVGGDTDMNGHGTFLASEVAALTGNGAGVAGAAPGVSILPVRVLGSDGSGDEASVASGIIYAADVGASVINLSLGSSERSPLVGGAIGYALGKGSVIVAAAGNGGAYSLPIYPAAEVGVIGVGALQQNGIAASFSSQGSWVDVVAPGYGIWGAATKTIGEWPCSTCYRSANGTSMAAPYVSAQVALMRAANPSLSPSAIGSLVKSSADDTGAPGYDHAYGYGRISPYRAVVWGASKAERLDGAATTVGSETAAGLYQGLPHVYYYESGAGNLRHGWWSGTKWYFETLDGSGGAAGRVNANVGRGAAVFPYAGQAHVAYRDDTNDKLRHGYYTPGIGWKFEVLGSGGEHPFAMLYQGLPHVFYGRGTDLGHSWYAPGVGWSYETLDGAGGVAGRVNADVGDHASAAQYGSQLQLFYDDETNADLRHAWYASGVGWRFETLDANNAADPSVALFGGTPHVVYTQNPGGDGNLRHAWWSGTKWMYETLDGHTTSIETGQRMADLGLNPVIATFFGLPQVWYYDEQSDELRHGWWTGAAWRFRSIDGNDGVFGHTTGNVGTAVSVTSVNGWPHLFYYDSSSADLRHSYQI